MKIVYDELQLLTSMSPGHHHYEAPGTLHGCYILEDVPVSLVPIASLCNRLDVSACGYEP